MKIPIPLLRSELSSSFCNLQTDTDPPILPPSGSIDNTADYTIVQSQSSTTDMGCAEPLQNENVWAGNMAQAYI